jgi:alpha-D-xyloside xylohydrolase
MTVDERKGDFNGMLKTRTFKFVFIDKDNSFGFDPDVIPERTITYTGKKVTIGRK